MEDDQVQEEAQVEEAEVAVAEGFSIEDQQEHQLQHQDHPRDNKQHPSNLEEWEVALEA